MVVGSFAFTRWYRGDGALAIAHGTGRDAIHCVRHEWAMGGTSSCSSVAPMPLSVERELAPPARCTTAGRRRYGAQVGIFGRNKCDPPVRCTMASAPAAPARIAVRSSEAVAKDVRNRTFADGLSRRNSAVASASHLFPRIHPDLRQLG